MFFPPELASYRAFRFPWASGLPAASVTINEVLQGNTYIFNEPGDTTATRIKFNLIQSILYNSVTVKRYEYGPVNPQFMGRAPALDPRRIVATAFGIDSLNVDIYFQLDHFSNITEPDNITVYGRLSEGSGTFMPLSTTYNPGTNELMVSSVDYLGEFIFAIPDVNVIPVTPVLVSPENNKIVNQNLPLDFEWSPQGFANKFWLQISTEANFNSTEVDDSSLIDPSYTLAVLLSDQQYFWRVRSKNSAGWGDWTNVWSFTAAESFLDLSFPNGGEVWRTDSSLTIKWDHNLLDSVRIELYRDDVFFSVIVDSMFSLTGGYRWWALDSIPDGSNYKINITTLDGSFEDMSDADFTIIYIPVNVEQIEDVATDFNLNQNYPNPFNPSTTIRYSIPTQSKVSIKVFNSIGEYIAILVDINQFIGSYEINWDAGNFASGIYFYSIEAIPTDGTEYFHSVKKMILLK